MSAMVLGLAVVAMAQPLDKLAATAATHVDGTLLVGMENGEVLGYDAASRNLKYSFKGMPKVSHMKAGDGYVYWLSQGARYVQYANLQTGKVSMVPVPQTLVPGQLQRLSLWQGGVLVHGENKFVMLNPVTEKFNLPEFTLNKEVWDLARQGMVDTFWQGDRGMFVVVRRYGKRTVKVEAGETTEMSTMTAWSADERGAFQLLGHYACPLVEFRDASGPDVLVQQGAKSVRYRFGTGQLGNLKMTSVGMVALTDREVKVAPFAHENWMPNSFRLAFAPKRPQNVDANGSDVWWTDAGRAYRASVEDGSSEVFVPAERGDEFVGVVADEDGAWLFGKQGVRRIEPGVEESGFKSFAIEADGREVETIEQSKLASSLMSVQGQSFADGEAMVAKLLANAKLPGAGTDFRANKVEEVAFGDVVFSKGEAMMYVGSGRVLAVDSGIAGIRKMEIDAQAEAFRVVAHTPVPEEPARYVDRTKKAPVQPAGKSRPSYTPPASRSNGYLMPRDMSWGRMVEPIRGILGGIFKVVKGAAFDRPHKAKHHQLLEEAMSWIGTPYDWAGNTKRGVDCSGFVKAVYKKIGINLPRHSQDIGRVGFGKVVKGELHFGDVMVLRKPSKHVTIYIGDGKIIHATPPRVRIDSVYRYKEVVVRRFID